MNSLTAQLLEEIDAHLRRTGMSETAFGIAAVGDGHLVSDLRSGVDFRSSKIIRVRAYMRTAPETAPARRQRPRRRSTCAA